MIEPRPASSRDPLHRDEHHAGRRDRREVQPVDEQRLPDAIGCQERADNEHQQCRSPPARGSAFSAAGSDGRSMPARISSRVGSVERRESSHCAPPRESARTGAARAASRALPRYQQERSRLAPPPLPCVACRTAPDGGRRARRTRSLSPVTPGAASGPVGTSCRPLPADRADSSRHPSDPSSSIRLYDGIRPRPFRIIPKM